MIVLGIDAATETVSVALVDGTDVIGASETRSERRHAEDLTPMIEFVVSRASLDLRDIDAVAVDVGPGLFTGMRVGIAAAQALAHVLGVPLVGIDGLDALTAATNPSTDYELVVPTVDARRKEVAWAMHRVRDDGSTVRVSDPTVGSLDDLVLALRDRAQACLLVGEYAMSHRDSIVSALGPQSWAVGFGDSTNAHPHAKHVALLAHARLLRGESFSDESDEALEHGVPRVAAMYLRDADAEINWKTRSNS